MRGANPQDRRPLEPLSNYGDRCRSGWLRLLGANATAQPKDGSNAWLRHRARRILQCLPALGSSLDVLLDQVGLELTPAA